MSGNPEARGIGKAWLRKKRVQIGFSEVALGCQQVIGEPARRFPGQALGQLSGQQVSASPASRAGS